LSLTPKDRLKASTLARAG